MESNISQSNGKRGGGILLVGRMKKQYMNIVEVNGGISHNLCLANRYGNQKQIIHDHAVRNARHFSNMRQIGQPNQITSSFNFSWSWDSNLAWISKKYPQAKGRQWKCVSNCASLHTLSYDMIMSYDSKSIMSV